MVHCVYNVAHALFHGCLYTSGSSNATVLCQLYDYSVTVHLLFFCCGLFIEQKSASCRQCQLNTTV